MRIRGIFFDAAGVFYDREEKVSGLVARRLGELGYSDRLSSEDEERRDILHTAANEGRMSHDDYWVQVLQLYGVSRPDVRDQLKEQALAQTFNVFAYPGGRETLAELQARGFVLGIITDTIYPLEWKMAWLCKVGVAEYIKIISCSSVLGAHKPQPEMYFDALRQARLLPAEAAFVGHDATELEGARCAGMVTVAVNRDAAAKAEYYVDSLIGLLGVPIFQKTSSAATPSSLG